MKNGDYILVKAPDNYPGKKYRGRYCYEHILVYWQTFGVFPPEGFVVHHKDFNPVNNEPENLILLPIKIHNALHSGRRGKLVLKVKCPCCGKIFIKDRRGIFIGDSDVPSRLLFCSKSCCGILFSSTIEDMECFRANNVLGQYKQFADGTLVEFSNEALIAFKKEQQRKKEDKIYRTWLRSVHIKQNKKIVYKRSVCSICNKPVTTGAKFCVDCYSPKTKRPEKDILIDDFKSLKTLSAIGRKYGVSGNSVRKWCKSLNINYKEKNL